ncbi:hypothetical protein LCGC14_1678200 [marine sediment metagenome]|uniref:Uncharacterized protein n=1 Tax=marine sediment metagenome TaxID=412755 RepID=A0A0F9HPH0_9ZZZZ
MSEPLIHIERVRPPWRKIRLTECGRVLGDVAAAISFDEAVKKINKEGIQRASFSLCMSCFERVRYGQRSWDENPTAVMHRDNTTKREDLLSEELRALSILFGRHEDEYKSIFKGLQEVVDLSKRRKGRN